MQATDVSKASAKHGPDMFDPFICREMKVRNRIVMSPMTRRRSPDGVPTVEVENYYARRAMGGVGLIISEGTYIDHPASNGYADVPAFHGQAALAAWRRVVEAVHANGAAIVPQLWHVGAVRRVGTGPDPAVPGYGPMRLDVSGENNVHPMSTEDIEEVVASYGRAAATAADLGFDGVEVHGAHGYLIDQFLWDKTNSRTDHYGGTIENRVRFATEVCAEVRRNLLPGMPLIFRFSQWKATDYAARLAETPGELARILLPLRDAGVDIFHASTRRFWEPAFAGSPSSLGRWAREITGCPVIGVGSVGLDKEHRSLVQGGHTNATANVANVTPVREALARGDFDLVAVGRALLADPNWANKVLGGRTHEIQPLRPEHLEEFY